MSPDDYVSVMNRFHKEFSFSSRRPANFLQLSVLFLINKELVILFMAVSDWNVSLTGINARFKKLNSYDF